MNQRQVQRLRLPYKEIRKNAIEQLDNALVLHWRLAIKNIKRDLKHIFRLKCGVCGNRHFLKPLHIIRPMYELRCFYGYFENFDSIVWGTWFHLLHGED